MGSPLLWEHLSTQVGTAAAAATSSGCQPLLPAFAAGKTISSQDFGRCPCQPVLTCVPGHHHAAWANIGFTV